MARASRPRAAMTVSKNGGREPLCRRRAEPPRKRPSGSVEVVPAILWASTHAMLPLSDLRATVIAGDDRVHVL